MILFIMRQGFLEKKIVAQNTISNADFNKKSYISRERDRDFAEIVQHACMQQPHLAGPSGAEVAHKPGAYLLFLWCEAA